MVSRELYPFASHFLDRQGLRLHYIEEGAGEPIVLVHGNPTWSLFLRDLIVALRTTHRTIAPDHMGCGLSDRPDEQRYDYRLKSRVDDLEALLETRVPTGKVTLVLHDWGGMIGMAWASRHPQRLGRLIVLNTAAFRNPAGRRLPWQLWLIRNTPLGPLLVRGLNAFSQGLVHTCSVRRLPRAVRQGYLAPYRSWKDRLAVLRFIQDIPLTPNDPSHAIVLEVEQGLQRFRDLPVLLCWGRRDFVFHDAFLHTWQRHFPQAEVHPFEDGGHLVLEDAAERIIPLVQDFLRRHPVTPP